MVTRHVGGVNLMHILSPECTKNKLEVCHGVCVCVCVCVMYQTTV